MQHIEIPNISLAEAVLFAMDDAAITEAARQLELNRRNGNTKRVENWKLALQKLRNERGIPFSTAA